MSEAKRYGYLGIVEEEDGEVVKWEDYAALKAQRDALAAENVALISAFMPKEIPTEATDNFSDTAVLRIDGDEFQSWQWVDNQDEVIRGVLSFFKPETPATDAYLNSVRAEGVEALTKILQVMIEAGDFSGHEVGAIAGAIDAGNYHAAQLRAGKDGE